MENILEQSTEQINFNSLFRMAYRWFIAASTISSMPLALTSAILNALTLYLSIIFLEIKVIQYGYYILLLIK